MGSKCRRHIKHMFEKHSNFHCPVWIEYGKCMKMSTNKPSIGSVILETSHYSRNFKCLHQNLLQLYKNDTWLGGNNAVVKATMSPSLQLVSGKKGLWTWSMIGHEKIMNWIKVGQLYTLTPVTLSTIHWLVRKMDVSFIQPIREMIRELRQFDLLTWFLFISILIGSPNVNIL